ncbi:hypothetical protein C4D60_Mb01t11180 [Musa balbisiana]|uniref:Hexosyltransferase n=1 Tax=Musa balbisiana TaxID=52838 RepID=A0A4S8JLF9_MUSBA|nr:hypothetical protein C4D60_Mb01t11180 [Musa balbisiana]
MWLHRRSGCVVIAVFAVSSIIYASLLRHGVEDEGLQFKAATRAPSKGPGYPPVFAFRISGTGGEHHKILRLLTAQYHPRNRYLLPLDAGSTASERI